MISGIVFKNDNETIINESSKEKYNLDDLPIPNRELADLEDYITIGEVGEKKGLKML